MIIVMPMAGLGSRFADAGIETPKPMIDVCGLPMYAWSMAGLPFKRARKTVLIAQRKHLHRGLEDDIRHRFRNTPHEIIALDGVTDGQLCTVLMAEAHLTQDEPLLIFNADTYCRHDIDLDFARYPGASGILSVFHAPGERWSFAKTDGASRVVQTAEKERISDLASNGLYAFRSANSFLKLARDAVAQGVKTKGEYYIAPLYNTLIQRGADVRATPAESTHVMGTPQDLEEFHRVVDATLVNQVRAQFD